MNKYNILNKLDILQIYFNYSGTKDSYKKQSRILDIIKYITSNIQIDIEPLSSDRYNNIKKYLLNKNNIKYRNINKDIKISKNDILECIKYDNNLMDYIDDRDEEFLKGLICFTEGKIFNRINTNLHNWDISLIAVILETNNIKYINPEILDIEICKIAIEIDCQAIFIINEQLKLFSKGIFYNISDNKLKFEYNDIIKNHNLLNPFNYYRLINRFTEGYSGLNSYIKNLNNEKDINIKYLIEKELLPDTMYSTLAELIVRNNPRLIIFLENHTSNLCKIAIENEPSIIEYLKYIDKEIIKIGLNKDPQIYKLLKSDYIDLEICKFAVFNEPELIKIVKYQDYEMAEFVVNANPHYLQYISNQDLKLCKIAIYKDPDCIKYAHFQDKDMCLLALKHNINNKQYIKINNYEISQYLLKNDIMEYIDIIKSKTKDYNMDLDINLLKRLFEI